MMESSRLCLRLGRADLLLSHRPVVMAVFICRRSYNSSSDLSVLGLPSSASKAEIKSAYFLLAKQLHPDSPGGNAARFVEVNSAYRRLMTGGLGEESKEHYRRYGEQWGGERRDRRSRERREEQEKAGTGQTYRSGPVNLMIRLFVLQYIGLFLVLSMVEDVVNKPCKNYPRGCGCRKCKRRRKAELDQGCTCEDCLQLHGYFRLYRHPLEIQPPS